MLHLALSPRDAAALRLILEAKLVDLRREITHTDSRKFRNGLRDIAIMLEGLVDELARGLSPQSGDVSEQVERGSQESSWESEPSDEGLGECLSVPPSITQYLREHDVDYSVIHHHVAYTALREAAASHVPGREWAKAVVFMADNQPTLAVVPADYVVDTHRLRDLTGAKQLRLATEGEIASLYQGCEPGAMPPLGPLYGQRVFVDESMVSNAEIAFNAGSYGDAIRMRYRDFEKLVGPTVARFGRMH
ncbi:MAG: aminoacyl-tRNA deacylase [Vicinamibacterales bacterium]